MTKKGDSGADALPNPFEFVSQSELADLIDEMLIKQIEVHDNRYNESHCISILVLGVLVLRNQVPEDMEKHFKLALRGGMPDNPPPYHQLRGLFYSALVAHSVPTAAKTLCKLAGIPINIGVLTLQGIRSRPRAEVYPPPPEN